MTNKPLQLKPANLPSRDDIRESIQLVSKRREFYQTIQQPAWFTAREAQLQLRVDQANQDLLQLHDSLKRSADVLRECDLHEIHLLEQLEEHDRRVAEQRAEKLEITPKLPAKKPISIPARAMKALKRAYPTMTEAEIRDLLRQV